MCTDPGDEEGLAIAGARRKARRRLAISRLRVQPLQVLLAMMPLIVIPARMSSTRLPGQAAGRHRRRADDRPGLAPRDAKPGWGRSWSPRRGRRSPRRSRRRAGDAVLTDPALPSGSDRVKQALDIADPSGRHDVIVCFQGDLPTIDPAAVRAAVEALERTGSDIATLVAPVEREADRDDPSVVKAVVAWDRRTSGSAERSISRARPRPRARARCGTTSASTPIAARPGALRRPAAQPAGAARAAGAAARARGRHDASAWPR